MLELTWGAGTDTGHRRQRNEDAYLVSDRLFAVADGMGGHARGDVAAALAISTLVQLSGPHLTGTSTVGPGALEPAGLPVATDQLGQSTSAALVEELSRASLLDAVRAADRLIATQAVEDPDRPMGTTICGIGVLGEHQGATLLAFNVGDSRIYRLREALLEQVSHDHSVVQELVDQGELDPDLAELHPERNVITRSLGAGEPLDVDWWPLDARSGDRYLLCSDGLVKEVTTAQIKDILTAALAPQEASDALIRAALDGGGRDNVTVVVIDVVSSSVGLVLDDEALEPDTNPRHDTTAGPTQPRVDPTTAGHQPEADEPWLILADHVPRAASQPDPATHETRP